MNGYYKAYDFYNGEICTLTNRKCSEECTKCVFALVAFTAEMKRKEEDEELKEKS